MEEASLSGLFNSSYQLVWLFPQSVSSIIAAQQSFITANWFPIDLRVRRCRPSKAHQHQECWQKDRCQHVNSRRQLLSGQHQDTCLISCWPHCPLLLKTPENVRHWLCLPLIQVHVYKLTHTHIHSASASFKLSKFLS